MELTFGSWSNDHDSERVRSRRHTVMFQWRLLEITLRMEGAMRCLSIGRGAYYPYLEDNQRAISQIVPQLLISFLHIPIRVRGSPKLG